MGNIFNDAGMFDEKKKTERLIEEDFCLVLSTTEGFEMWLTRDAKCGTI